MNRQDAPVKSCFAGPAMPAFHRTSKRAKKSFCALLGEQQGARLRPGL